MTAENYMEVVAREARGEVHEEESQDLEENFNGPLRPLGASKRRGPNRDADGFVRSVYDGHQDSLYALKTMGTPLAEAGKVTSQQALHADPGP